MRSSPSRISVAARESQKPWLRSSAETACLTVFPKPISSLCSDVFLLKCNSLLSLCHILSEIKRISTATAQSGSPSFERSKSRKTPRRSISSVSERSAPKRPPFSAKRILPPWKILSKKERGPASSFFSQGADAGALARNRFFHSFVRTYLPPSDQLENIHCPDQRIQGLGALFGYVGAQGAKKSCSFFACA